MYDSYEVEYLPNEGLVSTSRSLFIELTTDGAGTSTGIAIRYQGRHIPMGANATLQVSVTPDPPLTFSISQRPIQVMAPMLLTGLEPTTLNCVRACPRTSSMTATQKKRHAAQRRKRLNFIEFAIYRSQFFLWSNEHYISPKRNLTLQDWVCGFVIDRVRA